MLPPEDLARMSNQIAQYFAAYPEDEAIAGVRDHLEKFWDPQMRRDLLALSARDDLAADSPLALHPLVRRAIAPMRGGQRA